MKLEKHRDDRGITYRVVSLRVGGRKVGYCLATTDYDPRPHVARMLLYARREVRLAAAVGTAT